jgi:hypothetical protein
MSRPRKVAKTERGSGEMSMIIDGDSRTLSDGTTLPSRGIRSNVSSPPRTRGWRMRPIDLLSMGGPTRGTRRPFFPGRALLWALAGATLTIGACGSEEVAAPTTPDAAQDGSVLSDGRDAPFSPESDSSPGTDGQAEQQGEAADVGAERTTDAAEADAPEPPPNGWLVAVYDFEKADNLGQDSVGGHDAVTVVAASQVDGVRGKAVQFGAPPRDGGDPDSGDSGALDSGYLILPKVSDLMLASGGDFSLEIWLQTSTLNFNFFTCSTVTTHAWGLGQYSLEGPPSMTVNGLEGAAGKTNVYDGAWHHVVGTRTGATLAIYVDGRLEGTDTAVTPIRDIDCTLAIGRDGACCNSFQGKMDRARIWRRALTDAQVAYVYAH